MAPTSIEEMDLLPCPRCGETDFYVDEARMAPKMEGPGSLISVDIHHHCPRPDGVLRLVTTVTGRDYVTAEAGWNQGVMELADYLLFATGKNPNLFQSADDFYHVVSRIDSLPNRHGVLDRMGISTEDFMKYKGSARTLCLHAGAVKAAMNNGWDPKFITALSDRKDKSDG